MPVFRTGYAHCDSIDVEKTYLVSQKSSAINPKRAVVSKNDCDDKRPCKRQKISSAH